MATGNKKQGISWRDELYPSLAAARRRREEEELARAPSGQPSAAEVLYPNQGQPPAARAWPARMATGASGNSIALPLSAAEVLYPNQGQEGRGALPVPDYLGMSLLGGAGKSTAPGIRLARAAVGTEGLNVFSDVAGSGVAEGGYGPRQEPPQPPGIRDLIGINTSLELAALGGPFNYEDYDKLCALVGKHKQLREQYGTGISFPQRLGVLALQAAMPIKPDRLHAGVVGVHDEMDALKAYVKYANPNFFTIAHEDKLGVEEKRRMRILLDEIKSELR